MYRISLPPYLHRKGGCGGDGGEDKDTLFALDGLHIC